MPQISRILLEVVGKSLVHGGHPEKHGSAGLELADDILRTEWHEDGAAAGDQRTVERDRQAVNMEQGQRQHQPVRGGPSPGLDHAARLGEKVAMIEQRPFWPARRTGGVEQQRWTLRVYSVPTLPFLSRKSPYPTCGGG